MAVRDPDTEWVRVQTCLRMAIAARMYKDAVSLVLHPVLPDCLRQKSMHACNIYRGEARVIQFSEDESCGIVSPRK